VSAQAPAATRPDDGLYFAARGQNVEKFYAGIREPSAEQWAWIRGRLEEHFGHDPQQLAEMAGYFGIDIDPGPEPRAPEPLQEGGT
jgi:hypothetical protein